MFTIVPYNRFRDLALQRRRRGLILPGLVLPSLGSNSFDLVKLLLVSARDRQERIRPPAQVTLKEGSADDIGRKADTTNN